MVHPRTAAVRRTSRPAAAVVIAAALVPVGPAAAALPAQPYASYWFAGSVPAGAVAGASSILNWDPATDPDAAFNTSTVPLAARFSPTPVNANATNTAVGVQSLAAFGTTSATPSQGTASMAAYTPTHWQYTSQLAYWGGSAGEGNILAPPGSVVDAAHRNGVPVLGNVFFGPTVYGGRIAQVNAMLAQRADGSFPVADQMVRVAQTYGFDGWFLNQETAGSTSATATKMQAFVQYLHAKAPAMTVEWYDAMTSSGAISYQNALNANNQMFLQKAGTTGTAATARVADGMFLNYNYTTTGLANSATLATNLGRSKYALFAGIDVESAGYKTSAKWSSIFPSGTGASAAASIGLYRPDQTFNSAAGSTDAARVASFTANESNFWDGAAGDPTNTATAVAGTTWKGIANYVAAQSSVTGSGTFATSFGTGQGQQFAVAGAARSTAAWSNIGLQDVQPTYRWLMTSGGAKLTPAVSYASAYYGGASLSVTGSTSAANTLDLYATQVPIKGGSTLKIAYATGTANAASNLAVLLRFADGTSATLPTANTSSAEWNVQTLALSAYAGRTLADVSLVFNPNGVALTNATFNVGQLVVTDGSAAPPSPVTAITQTGGGATNATTDGTVRLAWPAATGGAAYNVYQRLANGTSTWVGGTAANAYFVQNVKRQGTGNFVDLDVETVGADLSLSAHATAAVYVDWARAAQTLSWRGNGATTGGAGTWGTTAATWNAGASAPANQYWSNQWGDTASFAGTGGTVTVAAPVSAAGLTFGVNGYALTGPGPVTLVGAAPTVSVTRSTDTAAVATVLSGAAGLTKTGAGTLAVSGINTYAGGTTVSAGTLTVAGPLAVSTGTVTLAGGTLALAVPRTAQTLAGFGTFALTRGGSNGGPTVAGPVLTLTDGGASEANAAFAAAPQSVTTGGFSAAFTMQNNGGADGLTFTVHRDPRGAAAVGATGGSLGYGGAAGVAVANSGSVQFNIYTGGTTGTGFAANGGTATFAPTAPVDFATSADPVRVTLAYDAAAHTLAETLTDQLTGSTYARTFANVDFTALLGGPTGYVGFTAGTGATTSTQTVRDFTLTTTAAGTPGIANGVVAAAGTRSTLAVAATAVDPGQSVGSLAVNADATVALAKAAGSFAGRAVLVTPAFALAGTAAAPTGTVDVGSVDLVVAGGDLATLTAAAAAGFAGGTWAGRGLASSAAAVDPFQGVGVIANAGGGGAPLYAAFDGVPVSADDVLVRSTFDGDTNLDGAVTAADYTRIDAGFVHDLTGWANGDFNYDGAVDGSDYTLMDNAFNRQAAAASPAAAVAAVPEPTAIAAIGLAAIALGWRRRLA